MDKQKYIRFIKKKNPHRDFIHDADRQQQQLSLIFPETFGHFLNILQCEIALKL
ncbi:MAG: hypothetical protein PWQ71_922 [Bacteroidota bacterium]|nr:hypothetical protein [Bacteroidota bacterium]